MFKISRCYDSHTHFLGTGEIHSSLSLGEIRNPRTDLAQLKIQKTHFRGPWLYGFGWNFDPGLVAPHELSQQFPDHPVFFVRADGHSAWANEKALSLAGISDPSGRGLLGDVDKKKIDDLLPKWSRAQKKIYLQKAQDYFLKNGFTHIREMTADLEELEILLEMESQQELRAYLELNFVCNEFSDLRGLLQSLEPFRRISSRKIRFSGIKIFLDGALGSRGAYLSQDYADAEGRGDLLWKLADFKNTLQTCWQQSWPVSLHALGDESLHLALQAAVEVQTETGLRGILNLEHVEIFRNESLELMKQLDVRCFMQPCHWLSDHSWLKERLGNLSKLAFRWEDLRQAGIPIYWGSDSPVEPASVFKNFEALQRSAQKGILSYAGDLSSPHQHPDSNWGARCESWFDEGKLSQLILDGEKIL